MGGRTEGQAVVGIVLGGAVRDCPVYHHTVAVLHCTGVVVLVVTIMSHCLGGADSIIVLNFSIV